jgi:hypothetical protein
MSNSFREKSKSLVFLVSAAASATASASIMPTTVALSGATAPGGGTFNAFTNPVLNATGEVAFAASVTGGTSTSGIFTETPASIQAIALQGTAAPAGGNYGNLFTSSTSTSTTLNSTGTLAFTAPLTGGTSTSGIFAGSSAATLGSVALQGTAAPAGGNYNAFLANGTNQAYSPVLNSVGQLALQSTLTGGTSAAGIFTGTSAATLQTVALVGGAAPTPPGGTYATTATVPTINSAGQVAFVSIVGGLQGIFAGTPGAAQTVMYQGTAAPGTLGEIYGTPTTTYSYNNLGQAAFISSITGGSLGQPTTGVFVGAPGSVQNVALGASTGGSLAPGGTGGSFTTLSSVTVNGLGQVAFTAGLTGGTSTSGLFLGSTSSNLQAVALVGGTSPDGETYSSFGSTELTNDNGEVAFLVNLSGADVTAGVNSEELVAGTPGNLTELVREGDVINGLTVNGFGLLTGSGGQDGKGMDFNDLNEVAYRLTFTNGTSGVFESAVPEPTSLGLIVAGGAILVRRTRRRTV